MATIKFSNLTKFNEFLKYHIELVESFDRDTAVLIERPEAAPYDNAELLEGIDQEYGEYFTYVY